MFGETHWRKDFIMKRAGILATTTIALLTAAAAAQTSNGTSFSYQGLLKQDDAPAHGSRAMKFRLFNAASNGVQVGGDLIRPTVAITDGLFNVELDFGAEPFAANEARWLEVEVEGTLLAPRQPLTSAPFSLATRGINVDSQGRASLGGASQVGKLSIRHNDGRALYFERPGLESWWIGPTTNGYAGLGFANETDGTMPMLLSQDGKVGLGTTQPEATLHVQQATDTNLSGALVTNSAVNRSLHFWVDAASRGRIDVGSTADSPIILNGAGVGPIGIGTSDPSTRLTVQTPNNAFGIEHTNGVHRLVTQISSSGGTGGGGRTFIGSVTNADFALFTNNSTRLAITAAGNVGIGTANPDRILDVNGAADFGANIRLFHVSDGNKNWQIGNVGGGNDDDLSFTPGLGGAGAASVVFTRTGNVGIGTETPVAKLDVAGVVRCDVLEIDGGADISEPFEIAGESDALLPGMVVCIDFANPERLMLSAAAYDRKVAGVISGANGVKPGLMLRQEGTAADGTHPVALTGRVYVWCDADAGGPIEPGDLLTTSDTRGHAMKVSDHTRANGAVLGKAMGRLDHGRGMVLVLVALQ